MYCQKHTQKKQKKPKYPKGNLLMEETMKKVLLITLLAMLLISTLVTGCKKKAEEPQTEETPIEEAAPATSDTATVTPEQGQTPTTTTPVGK